MSDTPVKFKVNTAPTYAWPVSVPQHGENGEVEHWQFTAHFARLSQDEQEALHAKVSNGEMTNAGYVAEVFKGFDPVPTQSGEISDTPAGRTELLGIFPVMQSIVNAHRASLEALFLKN